MNKVVGVSFSPRKLGNCEIAIKEIINNIPVDVDFELINMHKFKIEKCIACYQCLFKNGKCKIDDDFYTVFEKIINADALIFAVPSYFLGPNSSFKVFLDRFLISYAFYEKLYNKPAILISTAGLKNGGEGYVDLALKSAARVLNLNIKGSAIFYGALPGEILLNNEYKNNLKALGKKLFEQEMQGDEDDFRCNICGSNYFEFHGNNFITCLVCKNKGKIVTEDGSVNVYIEKSDVFFGTEEANLKHKKWLMSMKERFIKERDKLKELTRKYL